MQDEEPSAQQDTSSYGEVCSPADETSSSSTGEQNTSSLDPQLGLMSGRSLAAAEQATAAAEAAEATEVMATESLLEGLAGSLLLLLNLSSDEPSPAWKRGVEEAQRKSRQLEQASADTQTLPDEQPETTVQECPLTKDAPKPKRYTVRVHAQGEDCGGTTGSTIGAPALTLPMPVPVADGLRLSAETQGLLNRRQLNVRSQVIAKAEDYIRRGPTEGGRFGPKSFVVRKVRGGLRYDVDCFGDGPSFQW